MYIQVTTALLTLSKTDRTLNCCLQYPLNKLYFLTLGITMQSIYSILSILIGGGSLRIRNKCCEEGVIPPQV